MRLGRMMKMNDEDWDYYSGLPSPRAYEKRNKIKKMNDQDFEDGVDDYSPLYRDKTTFSDTLEDEE